MEEKDKLAKIVEILKDRLHLDIRTDRPIGKGFKPLYDTFCPKFYHLLMGNHWKENSLLYSMSVWNDGVVNFYENSPYCQGRIVDCTNNTNFRYYILVTDNNVKVFSYERRYYGMEDAFCKKPYEFNLK